MTAYADAAIQDAAMARPVGARVSNKRRLGVGPRRRLAFYQVEQRLTTIPPTIERYAPEPDDSPLSAISSRYSRFRPTSRATVSRICESVPASRMLCLPENSET